MFPKCNDESDQGSKLLMNNRRFVPAQVGMRCDPISARTSRDCSGPGGSTTVWCKSQRCHIALGSCSPRNLYLSLLLLSSAFFLLPLLPTAQPPWPHQPVFLTHRQQLFHARAVWASALEFQDKLCGGGQKVFMESRDATLISSALA